MALEAKNYLILQEDTKGKTGLVVTPYVSVTHHSFLSFTSSKHGQNCRETITFRETVSKKSCNSRGREEIPLFKVLKIAPGLTQF